ncbi:MAG: biotin--[acetyl-CoA-carboxylase] ligase [Salaquimonas sp.]|nr:biotin--[acetyl-CoA-carboxylase] ligase [Salaquimonas sp.]
MLPTGYRLIELDETVSTNSACLEAAQAGDSGYLWIRAEHQLSGRGSRGRSWTSGPGNLFASLLLIDPAPSVALANLTFVAALGVHEAIAALAVAHGEDSDIRLKWPNDVLVSSRKVSGILLESHEINIGGKRRRAIIIGIGINCMSHPHDVPTPATNLAVEGMTVSARDMMGRVALGVDNWLKRWDRGRNFDEIRRHWLSHATGLSKRIEVHLANRELTGIFEGIDETGMLRLRLDDGQLTTISSADVFFDVPPAAG